MAFFSIFIATVAYVLSRALDGDVSWAFLPLSYQDWQASGAITGVTSWYLVCPVPDPQTERRILTCLPSRKISLWLPEFQTRGIYNRRQRTECFCDRPWSQTRSRMCNARAFGQTWQERAGRCYSSWDIAYQELRHKAYGYCSSACRHHCFYGRLVYADALVGRRQA